MKSFISLFGAFSLFFIGKPLISESTEAPEQKRPDLPGINDNMENTIHSKVLEFAGQEVPVSNPIVKHRFIAEMKPSKYWRYIASSLIGKTNKYFPVIRPILKSYNIPDDFKYLPLTESGFANEVSYSGAAGPWQLMPETAKKYGLTMNSQIDERYNLVLSTRAACKYLVHLHDRLHDWTLAAAAYNKGLDGVKNAVEKQKMRSYYKLRLNHQARQYLYRILAAKEFVENPKKYGYKGKMAHFYYSVPTYRLKINNSIANLSVFAKKHGTSLHILKTYNPWLIANRFDNPKRKVCFIEIPVLNEVNVPRFNP